MFKLRILTKHVKYHTWHCTGYYKFTVVCIHLYITLLKQTLQARKRKKVVLLETELMMCIIGTHYLDAEPYQLSFPLHHQLLLSDTSESLLKPEMLSGKT